MPKNRIYSTNLRNKMKLAFTVMLSLFITQQVFAEGGEDLFKKNCAACHRASAKDATGPGLAGVTENRSNEWIVNWVQASQDLISSGDADAKAIFEEFNSIPMPPFPNLSEEEITSIFSYVDETVAAAAEKGTDTTTPTDVDVEPVAPMSTTQKYFLYGACIFLILLVWFVRRFLKRIEQLKIENGVHDGPYAMKNYPMLFILYLAIAVLIAYLLSIYLQILIQPLYCLAHSRMFHLLFSLLEVSTDTKRKDSKYLLFQRNFWKERNYSSVHNLSTGDCYFYSLVT